MKIELLGPYRDTATGRCVDEDLIRIGLSRHRLARQSKSGVITIGHCRYTDESVLLFKTKELSEREKGEIISWVQELIHNHKRSHA